MLKRNEIELIAPVGSYESLRAAIQGNADAVYFGVGKLNMRSKSSLNFDLNDLKKIINICNENKVKAYVTLNSIIYDNDFQKLHETIDACKEEGVNAIIASDISAIKYSNSIGLEVHISTQQNISNLEAVKFFARFSDIIVLARELNLNQIKNIVQYIEKENITGPSGNKVKIEIFAHGALCMAISGKCYLSLHENNHSANRGECYQICRRVYVVKDKETDTQIEIDNEFIMSPKDLCTISFLDKILDSGIRVLKIEGRARSAEYVKTVTETYNEAIINYCEGAYNAEKIMKWLNKLTTVYNRGFWDGYYLGKKLGEWSNVYGSIATKKKFYIGKCLNYFSNIKVAEFIIETGSIQICDDILITGPTSGVIEGKVDEIRVNLLPVNSAEKGDKFSIKVSEIVRRSDKLYKVLSINPE